jgi:hypothetical protein
MDSMKAGIEIIQSEGESQKQTAGNELPAVFCS